MAQLAFYFTENERLHIHNLQDNQEFRFRQDGTEIFVMKDGEYIKGTFGRGEHRGELVLFYFPLKHLSMPDVRCEIIKGYEDFADLRRVIERKERENDSSQ